MKQIDRTKLDRNRPVVNQVAAARKGRPKSLRHYPKSWAALARRACPGLISVAPLGQKFDVAILTPSIGVNSSRNLNPKVALARRGVCVPALRPSR